MKRKRVRKSKSNLVIEIDDELSDECDEDVRIRPLPVTKNVGKFKLLVHDPVNMKQYGSFERDAPEYISNHKLNFD